MILGEVISDGFTVAHRHIVLIVLDLLWKALWLLLTLAAFAVIGWWFGSQFESIKWPAAGISPMNAWLAATVLRQFWTEHAFGLGFAVFIALLFSGATWLLLESFFRKSILQRIALSPWERAGARSARRVRVGLAVFLASRSVKLTILATLALVLAFIIFGSYLQTPLSDWPVLWRDSRGAVLAGLIVLAAVSFLLTILETLLRGNAIELLGTHLLEVAGLIATLLLFEGMIGASLIVTVAIGLLNAATMAEILFMLLVAVAALLLWNCLHSYLLLVRFSAVDIMNHDVAGI